MGHLMNQQMLFFLLVTGGKKSSVVEKYAQFKTTKRQGFHNEVYLYVMRLWS